MIEKLDEIEKKLNYTFKDRSLLTLALVHCSYVNENKSFKEHNERLEFLGDSVLGLVMAKYLYCKFPETSEGDLSYLRSRLVEAASCVKYVHKLSIESFILLGKGEQLNSGRGRASILADFFEALVGAIYLDQGIEVVTNFLMEHFLEEIEEIIKQPICNWKALLQDFCQKNYHVPPVYEVVSDNGPDHHKTFEIYVYVQGIVSGVGKGKSKKEAQQEAAKEAVKRLKIYDDKS